MRKSECGMRNDARGGWKAFACFVGTAFFVASPAFADVPTKVTFDDHVAPIFREHCLACHDSGGRSADLSLETFADAMTGGASGKVVEPGSGDSSRLYQLMAHLDEPVMPPGQDKLPDNELALVKAWIDGGLLENAGSKAMKSAKPAVAAFVPSADNRPTGEPAMPGGFYREPILRALHTGAVNNVAASPWAPLVAMTGQRQALLYHADTRELLAVVPFVVGTPEVVRFSRNGDLLLVAGGRGAAVGVVHLWDIKTGERISELGDELDTVLAADIVADHSLVALGGPRKRVQVLRTADGSLAYSITKHTDWITALEFSPDGKHLAIADRAGNGTVWEAATGRTVSALTGHKVAVTSMSWRGDSQLLATSSDDGEIRTWQPQGNAIKQWNVGSGILDVAFTKDGRLVSIGRDRVARLWNTEGQEQRRLGQGDDIGLSIATTHDDSLAVFSDWTGAVRITKLEDGAEVGQLEGNPPTLAMRVEEAKGLLATIKPTIAPAEQSLAAATMTLENATAAIEKHEAAHAMVIEVLAKLEQSQSDFASQLDARKKELQELDKAIASVRGDQVTAESRLGELKQQLAAVGNQEGEQADDKRTAEIISQITEQESALESILTRRQEAETKRPGAAKSQQDIKQQVDALASQIKQHRESLAQLEAEGKNLPDLSGLVTERDRLQRELDAKRQQQAEAEARIASLETEVATYAAAQGKLEGQLAADSQAAEAKGAELAKIEEQLAGEMAKVDKVSKELQDLKAQMEELETKRKELAGVAEISKVSATTLSTELGELASKKAKVEKAVSDFRAAVELRQQFAEDK